MRGPTVVKVGGSLLDWPELPGRLLAFLRARVSPHLALVCGGGAAAEWVRRLDHAHGLAPPVAHRLAIRAMDLNAHVLAALLPRGEVLEDPARLIETWNRRKVPILQVRQWLDSEPRANLEPLEESWNVTSDSIAARLARCLDAAELVLLKSAPLAPARTVAEAVALGRLDPAFPVERQGLNHVLYVNLREPGSPVEAI